MSITFERTRKEALAAGDLFYMTGKPCSNGHTSKRYARGGMCYECLQMHRAANRDQELNRVKKHHETNPDSAKVRCLRWRSKNKHKVNAIEAKRRAAKLQRTPPWLSFDHLNQIDKLYEEAVRMTAETGEAYHVDHIVPLQGETVSGLHVPWNLQVIPAVENLSKHNKYDERFAA